MRRPERYGIGKCVYPKGDLLIGEFQKCQKEIGDYIAKNGNIYEGKFFNRKSHGFGKYNELSHFYYIGSFENHFSQGKGTKILFN